MVKINDLQKHELVDWSSEVEEVLRALSEKAQIWRFLHMKNHEIFKRKYYCLIIPVTILSSITGAANLALGSIASGQETIINLVIGALGIIISVISTLNNIFSFQRRKDEHYRAAKDWYRVQRMIDVELSLQKSKRNNVSVFFHLVLQEIERIHDFHPNVREDVVHSFMRKYKNKKLTIDIPEILSIRKTVIFRFPENNSKDEQPDKKTEKDNKNNLVSIRIDSMNETPVLDKHSSSEKLSSLSKPSNLITMDSLANINESDKENKNREKRNSFVSKIGNFLNVSKVYNSDNSKDEEESVSTSSNSSESIVLHTPDHLSRNIYDHHEHQHSEPQELKETNVKIQNEHIYEIEHNNNNDKNLQEIERQIQNIKKQIGDIDTHQMNKNN